MIAVPVASERTAARLLATLRRLEAEYQVSPEAALTPGRRRSVRGPLRRGLPAAWVGLKHALLGGLLAVLLTALCAGALSGGMWQGSLVGLLEGSPLVPALSLTLGALGGGAYFLARRPPAGEEVRAQGAVTWLVSYVALERDEAGEGRLFTTVVRLTLPRSAEGRLKAVLARAGATSAE
jgi:hypothetical protein